jgi:4-hydroxy-tetrahydrodipicolinate reductase
VVRDAAKAGVDAGELAGVGPLGVEATADLDATLAREDVDAVVYCGLGDPAHVAGYLGRFVDAGKDAITVTGLVHPAVALGEEGARALHERAVRGGGRIVGTGWNPGYLLDVLPVMWGSSCVRYDRVYAQRVSEMRSWGPGIHDEVGLGVSPEEAADNPALSLTESFALVADGLALPIERTEHLYEPFVAKTRREHAGRVVEAGMTGGFRKRSLGYRSDEPVLELEWVAVFCIDPAVDGVTEVARVRVEGDTTIETEARGSFFGDSYPATAARAINALAPLRTLPPGLYRPDQLPTAPAGRW